MSNNLVSVENLDVILKAIRLGIVTKINSKDITAEQKAILTKANLIDTTTNTGKFLADNGTYIAIDTAKISDINTKTATVIDLFDIDYLETAYTETLPTSIPIPTKEFSAIYYDNKIYCIGGTDGTNYLNNVQIYDIVNKSWSVGTPMNTGRKSFASVLFGTKIYCLGGDNGSILNSIEVYDIVNNTWSTLDTSLPNAKKQFKAIVYNNKIYCLGDSNSLVLDIYDITNNTWSVGSSFTTKIYSYQVVVYNGKIYVIGGNDETKALNTLLIYDITSGVWTSGTACTTARYSHGVALFQGKIYIIGGSDGTNALSSTEVYDLTLNTWSAGCGLLTSKFNGGTTVTTDKGLIFSVSGENGSTLLSSIDIIHVPFTYYVLNLPVELQTKLNLIQDNGDGSKVLADNGQFIDIPLGYRFMDDTEVANFVTIINSYTG